MEILIITIAIIVIIIQLYRQYKTIGKLKRKIELQDELIKDLYRIDDERLLHSKTDGE